MLDDAQFTAGLFSRLASELKLDGDGNLFGIPVRIGRMRGLHKTAMIHVGGKTFCIDARHKSHYDDVYIDSTVSVCTRSAKKQAEQKLAHASSKNGSVDFMRVDAERFGYRLVTLAQLQELDDASAAEQRCASPENVARLDKAWEAVGGRG